MQITRALTLFGGLVLVALSFYATPTDACSCMPSHPQTHYCNADYGKYIK